jgi:tetratricopeptide (TPR) repeat protein
MLQTIHEYAGEKLEDDGDADALRRRHAEYFAALAERGERTMHYHAPAKWGARTLAAQETRLEDVPEERSQRELPNLRAALQWAFDKSEFELALRLAAAASWGWALSSAYAEGRAWLARVLDATGDLQTLDRARALFWLAEHAGWQGDFRSARTFNAGARELFELHHDQIGVFRSLLGLTQFEVSLGNLEHARVALEKASTLAKGIASDHELAFLYFKVAQVERLSGDYRQAQAVLETALQLCRKLGVPRRTWVNQLINVGWFGLEQHDFAHARAALEEYLAEDSGTTPSGIASAQDSLALIALYEGDREKAALRFRQALTLAREAGAKRTIAAAVYGLAAVAAIDGDIERSTRLWDAADAIRQSTGAPLSTQEQLIIERYLESARATLPEDVHRTARAEGSSMTLDEALVYALEQLDSAPST